ncbi:hypothetical protein [Streptomyces sp. NPDC048637]|uniref:hypothetical protein n=1 Tax=Streptomyces sp. NPDC048637 TaxID=3155636 RepID=UPI003420B4D7
MAQRIDQLTRQIRDLERHLTGLVERHFPQLLVPVGIGPDSAATLLITTSEVGLGVVGAHAGEGDHARDDDVGDLGVDVLPGVAVALAGVGAAGTDDGLGGFAGLLGDRG